ncbi:N-lysine methyltransferase setd6 [Rhinocladiella similis]
MDSSSDFETQSTVFLNWFKAQPGTQFHASLKIVDLRDRNAGRGIIATQDIPPDTDLFTIPRNIIISEETSTLAKKIPSLFSRTTSNAEADVDNDNDNDPDIDLDDEDPSVPDSWLNLILILLYESLQHSTSKWSPYLTILPQHPGSFNTLMFWTDHDLSALRGSAIPNKIGKESANRMFTDRIIPIVKRHADIFYPATTTHRHQQQEQRLSDSALLERCHIIGSLIMSYAFDLQPDSDDSDSDTEMAGAEDGWIEDHNTTATPSTSTMGMVPMADMLNADAEFNAHLSHGEDSLTMTSLREIKAGEEVLNYYGPLPNGELLRRYGYTSPKHARYDVVEVPWSLVKTVISEYWPQSQGRPQVARILTEIEQDEDNDLDLDLDFDLTDQDGAGFILERESGDPDDQGLCVVDAKFVSFPEDMVNVVSHVVTSVLSAAPRNSTAKSSKKTETTKVKSTTLEILSRIVRRRLDQYPTTVQEDENLLLSNPTAGRARMALDVRLGEKRLLVEALEWTESKLNKYRE